MKYSILLLLTFVYQVLAQADTLCPSEDKRKQDLPRQKIMVVVLENEDYLAALKQPFLSQIAKEGALLSNFFAETHPSQPNYIALISGSTHGIKNDSPVIIDRLHLGDLLEAQGLTWKVYAEAYPGNCDLRSKVGPYVRKHVPFLSFKNIQENPKRCANIVNSLQLDQDISEGTLPDFSLYVPDMNNDGHDTSVAFADKYLSKRFGPLLRDPRFTTNNLLVLTFDEGRKLGSNQIYTLLYGEHVQSGVALTKKFDHYSLLRTFEEILKVGTLGLNDQSAEPILDVWK